MRATSNTIHTTKGLFSGRTPDKTGKVRDIYRIKLDLLIVATDRVSAYDVVMQEPVPGKGRILTGLTLFWLNLLEEAKPHHLITADADRYPEPFCDYPQVLQGRSMLVHAAEREIPIECVVRGYLCGSAWKEYQQSGTVCGIALSAGLSRGQQLPEPIFTPATKAVTGHDENISFDQMVAILDRITHGLGRPLTERLVDRSLAIYSQAQAYARERGIIIADTKFEFGLRDGWPMLIDEVLTPDSSRFYTIEDYEAGNIDSGLDKQPLRDYLDMIQWDHAPPPPTLTPEVIEATRSRYQRLYDAIVGS